jgi:hypothetical protein
VRLGGTLLTAARFRPAAAPRSTVVVDVILIDAAIASSAA